MFAVAMTSDVRSPVARCSRPPSLTLVPWQLRNDPLSGGAAVLPRCSVLLGLDDPELGQLQAPRTSHVPGAWGDSRVCVHIYPVSRVSSCRTAKCGMRGSLAHACLILFVASCCLPAPSHFPLSTHMTRSPCLLYWLVVRASSLALVWMRASGRSWLAHLKPRRCLQPAPWRLF